MRPARRPPQSQQRRLRPVEARLLLHLLLGRDQLWRRDQLRGLSQRRKMMERLQRGRRRWGC